MILGGLILVIAGLGIKFFSKNLSWVGNLPGDVRIERENFKFYFPLTTMILLSILVNVLIRLVNYFR